ncbi:16221_t:CDS:2, partial [Funneliformis geosporum]
MNSEIFDNQISSILYVRALYDFDSKDNSSLSFKKDDIIQVLTRLESGWWDGVCNNERGWFPSNYVAEVTGIFEDGDEFDWITQQTPDGDTFYYNTRTGESSWEVPADDCESLSTTHTARDTISSFSSLSRQLPENWIQKLSEDDNNYHYYNVITKEISLTYPGDPDDEIFNSHVAHVEDDLGLDDDVTDKASIASSKGSQLSTASIDTIQQRSLQQRRSIENLPPNWSTRTLSQGRSVYYYNKLTDETTWSLDNINDDGQLIRTKHNESDDEAPNEPLPPIPSNSISRSQKKLKTFAKPSIIMLKYAKDNLTWDSLSENIDMSIRNLNWAAQKNMKQNYTDCINSIVDGVRIMLYASDTVGKNSIAIKQNRKLKCYHRNIMASLSKLVISTKLAANVWPPPDSAQKMKKDAEVVLGAVRNFIQTAQENVCIKKVDPKLIESTTKGSWRGNNLVQVQTNVNPSSMSSSKYNDSTLNSPTSSSHLLTPDLINSLDKISRTVTQAIVLLLNYVKKVVDTPNSSTPSAIGSFSPQLISQTKQVLTQVGQFLAIIEDLNLQDLNDSNLATINEFKVSKQALYNNLSGLVMCIQAATFPLSFLSAMDQVLVCTNVVDKSVKDVMIATKFLVEEKDTLDQMKTQGTRSRRSSNVDSTTKIRPSNNSNPLDQIDENDTVDDQTISATTTFLPISKSTVPEGDVDDNSTMIGEDFSANDVPISPTSNRRSFASRLRSNSSTTAASFNSFSTTHRTNTQHSAPSVTNTNSTVEMRNTQSKKQMVDKPWFLNYDYDPSELVFNMENCVKGGTLNALVERLTMHDILDSNFIATFLLTYRSFCTTDDFFDMLVKRFMIQPPENLTPAELEVWQEKKQTPIRLRVFNIMKTWLENYYIDDDDAICLERVKEFAKTTMYDNLAFAAVSLTKQQQPRDAVFKAMVMTNSDSPPPPILPKNINNLKFLDLDPLEIARQLTLIESKLYNKIRPIECLNKAWSKGEGDIAENINSMIESSNKITGWVTESVLDQSEIRRRCLYIKHFIAIADKCRILNNFNSLTAITSGLYSAPIHRLRRTWETVNAKTIATLDILSKIMNSTKNFAEYREMLHSINPPCVPFFGLYLTDLTFIEDGNPNYLKNSNNKLINFSKRMKTAEVIREIQQYQSAPYKLSPVQEVQTFIHFHLRDSSDVKDLYNKSLLLEPRERDDEKIARLLQES